MYLSYYIQYSKASLWGREDCVLVVEVSRRRQYSSRRDMFETDLRRLCHRASIWLGCMKELLPDSSKWISLKGFIFLSYLEFAFRFPWVILPKRKEREISFGGCFQNVMLIQWLKTKSNNFNEVAKMSFAWLSSINELSKIDDVKYFKMSQKFLWLRNYDRFFQIFKQGKGFSLLLNKHKQREDIQKWSRKFKIYQTLFSQTFYHSFSVKHFIIHFFSQSFCHSFFQSNILSFIFSVKHFIILFQSSILSFIFSVKHFIIHFFRKASTFCVWWVQVKIHMPQISRKNLKSSIIPSVSRFLARTHSWNEFLSKKILFPCINLLWEN